MSLSNVSPLAVAEVPGRSDQISADDAKHNSEVAAWGVDHHALEESESKLAENPERTSFAQLRERRDKYVATKLSLAQRAVSLGGSYVARQQARLAELEAYRDAKGADLTSVAEAVTKRLNAAGISAEADPAYAVDPGTAERKFDYQVRTHTDYRAAEQSASEAAENAGATNAAIAAGHERLAAAEAELRALTYSIVGLPAPGNLPRLAS